MRSRIKRKPTTAEQVSALQASFEQHISIETGQWSKIAEAVGDMQGKVDRIINVKINGAEGFENVVHHLWEATSGPRWRMWAREKTRRWFEAHPTVKSILVWLLKKFLWTALFITGVILAQYLGLGQMIERLINIIK
ncbi:MAG: hypothetical protein AB1428_13125 [Bacteroidota bacterium]